MLKSYIQPNCSGDSIIVGKKTEATVFFLEDVKMLQEVNVKAALIIK